MSFRNEQKTRTTDFYVHPQTFALHHFLLSRHIEPHRHGEPTQTFYDELERKTAMTLESMAAYLVRQNASTQPGSFPEMISFLSYHENCFQHYYGAPKKSRKDQDFLIVNFDMRNYFIR
jgi:hypothetical protein